MALLIRRGRKKPEDRRGRWLTLAILLVLVIISAGIDFSHIEKDGGTSSSCPACTFHLASVADSAAICLVLPTPTLNGTVVYTAVSVHEFLTAARLAARSPPLASL